MGHCGHVMEIGTWFTPCMCMYKEKKEVAGFSGQLGYVDTCPNQPGSGKVFCAFHCHEAMKNGIPTDLQQFKVFVSEG